MSAGEGRAVDWRQVRALVRAFLAMSVRKMPLRTMRGEKKGGGWGPILFLVGLYSLFGLLLAPVLALTKDVFLGTFTVHVMTLFVVGTAAMSEASDVLFNTSENDVLGHKPILPATLVVSKALTIIAFTLLIAGALNLGTTITLCFMEGARPAAPFAHVASVLLSTVFAAASVVCLHGLIARLLGRERLQRVVTWAQVASTIFLAAGFQIVPRLVDTRNGFDLAGLLHHSWFVWFVPPCWFAGFDAWLGSTVSDPHFAWLALVGLAVTAACTWLGLLRLPATGGNAASLQEETRPERAPAPAPVAEVKGGGRIERLLGRWLSDPVERASFGLAKAYILRERAVKVRLASALSFYVVFPVLALLPGRHDSGFLPLMMIWMCALVPLTILEVLRISANPAAADLFLYAPIEGGARLFHGVRKAAIVFVQAPLLVYLTLISFWVLRSEPEHLWLALPALLAMPTLSLLPGLTGEYLPLSAASRTGQRTAQTAITFLVMIPAGLLGFLAYLAQKGGLLWVLLAGELVAMIVLHTLLLKIVARRSRSSRGRVAARLEPTP
jgi:hypothetical protein